MRYIKQMCFFKCPYFTFSFAFSDNENSDELKRSFFRNNLMQSPGCLNIDMNYKSVKPVLSPCSTNTHHVQLMLQKKSNGTFFTLCLIICHWSLFEFRDVLLSVFTPYSVRHDQDQDYSVLDRPVSNDDQSRDGEKTCWRFFLHDLSSLGKVDVLYGGREWQWVCVHLISILAHLQRCIICSGHSKGCLGGRHSLDRSQLLNLLNKHQEEKRTATKLNYGLRTELQEPLRPSKKH